jgi:adenylate cyclase
VSDEVRATAGVAADALPQHDVEIRGRNEPMIVRAVADARMLSALVNDQQSVAA